MMKIKNLKRHFLLAAASVPKATMSLSTPQAALMLAAGLALALPAPQAPAATLTWDPLNTANGATINDGAGSWTAANVWNNGAGNQTWSSVTPDSAIFTGTVGGTVTLPSNINAGTVLINGAQNYTFSGSLLLALSTTGGLTVDNAVTSTITFNTNIGGPGGITKRGAGTMILSGPSASFNTFGNVSVEEGVLRITNNTAVNTAIARTITVASGAALESRANTFTSGTATNIVLNGDGIGGAGALRISTSSQSFSAGTRISLGSDAKIAADGLISNGVTLNSAVDLGSHTLTLGGDGTTSGVPLVTINGYFRGTTGGFILDLGVANSLVTFGTGQSNTYTGQTWVRGGRLHFNRGGTSNAIRGDGIARVSGDGSTNGVLADLYIGGGPVAATVSDAGNGTDLIADSAEVFMAASGTPTLQIGGGASTFTDTIGSLASANTGASLILSANATLTVNNGNGGSDGSGNTTFAGVISGAGNLAKSRSGTFTLTNANTYAGTTTVRQGALNIQNALALGTTAGGTSVLSGASLQLQNATGMTVAGEGLTLAGFGVANDGALRNLSGNNTWTGAIALSGSTRINSDSGLLTIANGITGTNRDLTVGGAGDTAVTGAIATGTGGLIKDGAGTLTLSGTSTYTGVTAVKGGTLLLDFNAGGATNIIAPSSALSLGGGKLSIKGGAGETDTQTFNGLGGTGGTLALNANGATSLTANLGAISRAGAYNFTGADTTLASGLAVSGVSNYTTTTVAGANNGLGRLGASLWNGGTWASTATDGSGTTFVVPWQGVFVDLTTNSYNLTPASFTNTTGDLRIKDGTGNGTAVTYNANTTVSSMFMVAPTFDTTVAITAGTTLNLDDGSGFGTVAIGGLAKSLTLGDVVNQGVITAGTTAGAGLSLRNTSPTSLLTVNTVIADNAGGAVSLNTEGSVVLRGANTYTGATGIAAGTLQIAGAGSLGGGNYAGAIVNDGLLRYSSSVNQTLSGAISGGGALTKDGTGNLVLTGASSYTGDTTITTGTLQISGAGSLGGGNYVGAIANNGLLQYSSTAAQTLAGSISGTGNLIKDGTGVLTLSGANTYTGDTTITTGTLRLAGVGSLGNGIYAPSIVNNGTLQYSATTTQVLTGNMTGSGNLIKDGTGTLTLTGANTYAGSTAVNGGTLNLDFSAGSTADIAPVTSALSLNGGTLLMNGGSGVNTQAFNGLGGTGGTLELRQNLATKVELKLGAISTSGAYHFIGGDTTLSGFNAVAGDANFVTTTQVGANDAATKLGASIWTYSDGTPDTWASTAAAVGGTTYVVPWNGVFTTLTTNSFNLTPASFTNTTGDLRIIDGTATGTAVSYTTGTTIGSLLMVASNFSTTVAINAGTTLTIGDGDGALGAVAISSKGLGLSLGNVVNQGVITAGTGTSASTLVLQNLDTVLNPGTVLTVNSVIANNSAGGVVSLTTSGPVVLAATNTYTGDTGISSGTLRLTGTGTLGAGNYAGAIADNGTLQYSSSAIQTLSGIISGAGDITKDGSGLLTLSGANTYDGVTTLSTGVLNIQNGSALGSTAGGTTVATGTTLQLQGGIAVGAEALTLNGTGVTSGGALRNVSGDNSWAGSVTLASASRINSDAGLLTISGGIGGTDQSLTVGGDGNTTISGVIGTAAGTLTKDGAGTLTLTGANTYTGLTTITAGTLQVGAGGTTGSLGTGDVLNNAALVFNRSDAIAVSNGISGGGTLTQAGSGTLTLSGVNTYTGATVVNAGTLAVDGSIVTSSALAVNTGGTLRGAGTVGVTTVNAGGTLANTSGTTLTMGDTTVASGATTLAGLGTSSNPALFAVTGNLSLAGALNVTDIGGFGSTPMTPVVYHLYTYTGALSGAGLTYGSIPGGTTNLIIQTSITGEVNLINTNGALLNYWDATDPNNNTVNGGTGTWFGASGGGGSTNWTDPNGIATTYKSANSVAVFAGTAGTVTVSGTTDAAGLMFMTTGYQLTGGTITLANGGNGATLFADTGVTATVDSLLSTSENITKSGAGTVALGALNTYTGTTTIAAGTLQISGSGSLGSGNYAANITDNGTLRYSSSAAQILSGIISGSGGITKDTDNASVLTLTGANTYDGLTLVNNGVVNIQNATALGSTLGGTTVASGAALQLQGGIAVGAEALTLNGDGVTNDGALRSMSGNNSWAGPVILASASRINSDAGLLTLSGDIGGAGQNLTVGGAGNTTVSGVIGTAGGTLTKDGAGTLTLSGVNTYTGDTTVSAGTLLVSGSGSLGSGNYAGAIVDDGAVQFATSVNQTLSGVISGGVTGTLTQSGAGTLTLTGVNTYAGATIVTGGTLSVATLGDGGVASNLGAASNAVTNLVIGGATLQYTGATASTDRGFTLNNGTTATFEITDSAANLTFAGGAAATTGALTKSGAGTLTLSGSNPFAYTGVTTVAGGTLALDLGATSNVLSSGNAVSMKGGTLDFLGATTNAQTLGSLNINAGANLITKSTFTGTVANGGGVNLGVININSGTLDIANLPKDPAGFQTGTQDSWIKASGMAPVAYIDATVTTNGYRDLVGVNSLHNLIVADSTPYARGATGISSTLSALVKFIEEVDGGRYGAGFNNTGIADVDATITLHSPTQLDPVTGLVVPSSHHTYWQGLINAYLTGTTTLDIGADNTLHLSDTAPITSMAGSNLVIIHGNLTAGTGDSGTNTIAPNTPGTITVATNRMVTIASTVMDNGTGVVSLRSNGTPTGTLTLSGANTYTGATTLSSGFVNVGSAENAGVSGPLGVGGAIDFAGGTLQYSAANTYDYSARFSTAAGRAYSVDTNGQNVTWATGLNSVGGTLTKSGTGTLTLTGDNAAVTSTTVSGGVLCIGDGGVAGTIGSATVAIAAGATLAFDRSDTVTVANTLSGSGSVVQDGTGETVITGDNSGLTGLTIVNRGKLVLDSTLASVVVNPGATLGGTGTVRGDLTNRGFLSPGHSPGNIAVAGNFTQTSSGTFNEEIASPSSFDTMTVGGSATLGGTLHVISFGGFTPTIGETYRIITAAGGVNGAFSTVVDDWGLLRVIVTYNANKDVVLSFADVALQPRATTLGLTPNRIATAGGIDAAAAADPGFAPLIDSVSNLDDAKFSRSLASLSPQGFERLWDNIRYNVTMVNNAVESRLQSRDFGEPDENIWMQAIRRVSQMDGDLDITDGSAKSIGVIIGADTTFGAHFEDGDRFTVGAMFEYSNDDVDMGDGGRSRVNHYLPGLYTRYRLGNTFLEAVGSYGYADYASHRSIEIGTDLRRTKSHTESWDRTVSVRAGHDFHLLNDALKFSPYAGFAHTRWEADGFTESGSGLSDLSVHTMKAESTASRLGFILSSPIPVGDWVFVPRLDLAWRHEFQQSRRDITANFGPAPFTVRTMLPAADGLEARAGLDVRITPRTTIYADFGSFWDGSYGHSEEYRVGVNLKF